MTDTLMDIDDLKVTWQRLDRKLDRQNALAFQQFKDRRMDTVRAHLRPLRWGQRLQIPFGVLVVVCAAWTWWTRWDLVNVRVAAMIMHAYGVALIAAGAHTLRLLGRLDYTAPVAEIQRQLARVQRWLSVSGLVLGMAWWLLWIPMLMMAAGASGRDILARAPRVLGWYAATCAVGLVVSLWGVWRAHRSRRPFVQAWAKLTTSGRSLHRADAALDEIRRWEGDADDEPAAPAP